jgi:hypothetical protein
VERGFAVEVDAERRAVRQHSEGSALRQGALQQNDRGIARIASSASHSICSTVPSAPIQKAAAVATATLAGYCRSPAATSIRSAAVSPRRVDASRRYDGRFAGSANATT